MGVFIREATLNQVGNEMVVFFRNAVGVLFFLPLALTRGLAPLRTTRPWAHLKRTFCGLAPGRSILLIATIIGTPAALV